MRIVVQRVKHTTLKVNDKLIAEIPFGIVCYVGFTYGDENLNKCPKDIKWYANKIAHLRIFEDEEGKMNRELSQVGGEILVVPNFTLYADCSHGLRPSFIEAMKPEESAKLYTQFVLGMRNAIGEEKVKHGIFRADMQIDQHNDGPITIIIDSDNIKKRH